MKFIDTAMIKVKAGDGGNGCVSFRREKYVPMGGPDGGNGGRGGHIILVGTVGISTLLDVKFRHQFKANSGDPGKGAMKNGREGADVIIPLPVGTLIFDHVTGELIEDLTKPGQELVIAKGGRGGRGNTVFKSSVNKAPRRADKGVLGEEKEIRLELKLLADVGLIGLPNAGKSTFLSVISKARPKIADYPFTTLSPVLGMVLHKHYMPFTVADIPGLIEGAHEGHGLGHQFLRHIERTKIFLHLISLGPDEEVDVLTRFKTIEAELLQYDASFKDRTSFVVLTKGDLISDKAEVKKLEKKFRRMGHQVFTISSALRESYDGLLDKISELLN